METRRQIFNDSGFVEQDQEFLTDKILDEFFDDIKDQINIDLLIDFYENEDRPKFTEDQYIKLIKSLDFLMSKRLAEAIIFAKYIHEDICNHAFAKNSDARIFCSSIQMEQSLFLTFCKYGISNRIEVFSTGGDIGAGLMLACKEGKTDVVKILLECYDIRQSMLDHCLEIASLKGYTKIAELLLNEGADVGSALNGQYDVIYMLLERGIDVNINDGHMLINACLRGDLKTVFLLDDKGVNIHIRNDEALTSASRNGHISIVKFLLEKGLDVHTNFNAPFQLASLNGYYSIVELFLEKYTEFKGTNCGLENSSKEGHFKIVKLLLDNGATDMRCLVYSSERGNYTTVKTILKYGVPIDIKYTAFLKACNNGQYSIVKLLLENGIEIHDNIMLTVVAKKYYDIAYLLLENGVNYNNQLLFYGACNDGNYDFIKKLLNLGITEKDGGLLKACEQGHVDIVELLIENGVNIHIENDKALIVVCSQGFYDIVKLLLENTTFEQNSLDLALEHALTSDITNILLEYEALEHMTNSKINKKISHKTAIHMEKYAELAYNLQSVDDQFILNDLLKFSISLNRHGSTKIIINKGVNINDDIMSYASKYNNQRMVEFLLNHNVGNKEDSMLEAINAGNYEIVNMLLDHGVDANNEKFLKRSIEHNKNEITYLLLSKGAIPNNKIIEMVKIMNKDEALKMINDFE